MAADPIAVGDLLMLCEEDDDTQVDLFPELCLDDAEYST